MRKYCVMLGIPLAIALSGCARLDNYMEQKVREASGILEDEDYVSYQNQIASGNVDEEGYYIQKIDEEGSGSVHVTFATNNRLDIQYFEDEDQSIVVDTSSYYCNPGECIYASVDVHRDMGSVYEFSLFEIYEYGENGEKILQSDMSSDFAQTGMVLQIPDAFEGTEISIVPVGKYNPAEILLNDYYVEDDGKENELDGKWLVDDREYTGDSVKLNPLSSHIVSYQYDKDRYFYVASEPECYYHDADDGMVIFNQRDAMDEVANYTVELCPYLQIPIVSGTERIVNVNSTGVQNIKANTELVTPPLKYGDKVLIETDQEWKELENMKSMVWIKTEPLFDKPYKYRYTLIVPEKGGEFLFDPSEYVYEHGSLEFQCYGSVVNDIQRLEKGRRIYYGVKDAEDGYWLPGGEHYIVVGDEEETRQQLKNIRLVQKVQTSVNLKQPVYGGKIIYYIDGREILSDRVDTYSGTIISMDFEPWEGWICNYKDGVQYNVNTDSSQSVRVESADVDQIFREDDDHKPALTLTIKKGVWEELLFDITASGLEMYEGSYGGKFWSHDYNLVDEQKIGTEENIILSMNGKSIPAGEAIKIEVEKTDRDKNKTVSEIRYVDDLTAAQEPIVIYTDSEQGKSEVWYQAVDITVSKVDVESFAVFDAGPNAIITVRNEDSDQDLKEGEFVERSQKVRVEITPKAGYYIMDGNTSDKTSYQDDMKYSKYLSDIEKIISEHPAEKYCEVTLDEADPFAKYTYTCGKENVSGVVRLKQGDKLTLKYEITDDSYSLKKTRFWHSDKKTEGDIEITADNDGKTITKADFGIEVTEGE